MGEMDLTPADPITQHFYGVMNERTNEGVYVGQ